MRAAAASEFHASTPTQMTTSVDERHAWSNEVAIDYFTIQRSANATMAFNGRLSPRLGGRYAPSSHRCAKAALGRNSPPLPKAVLPESGRSPDRAALP